MTQVKEGQRVKVRDTAGYTSMRGLTGTVLTVYSKTFPYPVRVTMDEPTGARVPLYSHDELEVIDGLDSKSNDG